MKRDSLRSKGYPPCDRWMDIMASRQDEPLPEEFLSHMQTCPACREAWSELREVWEALALDSEDVAVPIDLKEEVMQAVFGEDEVSKAMVDSRMEPTRSADARTRLLRGTDRRGGRRVIRALGYGAACLLLLIGCIRTVQLVVNPPRPDAAPPVPGVATVQPGASPLRAETNWTLVAFSPDMPAAAGVATLYQDGINQKMVIELSGLKPTADGHVYQAWLLDNGQRYNCGTFAVDASGKGSLVYDIANPYLTIDGIGITTEPDANGDAPRGPKVAGTSKTS